MEKIPLGVKLISYLYYFYSILTFITGLIIMSKGIKFLQKLSIFGAKDFVPDGIEGYMFTLGWVSVLLLGLLFFLFAQTIKNGKTFTRDLLLIFSSFGVLISLFVAFFLYKQATILIISNLVVIIYLLYNNKSIDYFLR